MTIDCKSSRLPGLDGLRGISILLVMMFHSGWANHLRLSQHIAGEASEVAKSLGLFGVPVFFVISGFLITFLLLREERRAGAISLKQFWVRRFFRIIPPVIIYVLYIIGYSLLNGVHLDRLDVTAVLLFFRDLIDGNPMLDHFWSLSIEEQFYLVWPLLLVFAPRRCLFPSAVAMIFSWPLLRIFSAWLLPSSLTIFITRLMRFDFVLVGCLVALAWNDIGHFRFFRRFGGGAFAVGISFVLTAWFLSYHFGVYPNLFGTISVIKQIQQEGVTALLSIGIACVLISVVTQSSRFGAFINSRFLTSVGVISYSLYLWQQFFFFAPHLPHWMCYLPVRLVFTFGVAACSYRLVERPFVALGHRFQPVRISGERQIDGAGLDSVLALRDAD